MTQPTKRDQWSSRTGFILAAIGGAIGLGNIWKFPYVAGTSGGSAFVVIYLVVVALVAVPILTAELMLGRCGRQSPPTAMLHIAERGKPLPVVVRGRLDRRRRRVPDSHILQRRRRLGGGLCIRVTERRVFRD